MSPRPIPRIGGLVEWGGHTNGTNGRTGANDDAPIKRLALVRASDVIMQPVSYLWTDRVPRAKTGIIDGVMGTGKTTLFCAIAAAVTNGGPLPGQAITPSGDIILISLEDDLDTTLVPRLKAAGADLKRCHLFNGYEFGGEITDGVFNLVDDAQRLAQAIRDVRAAYVGIDPIMAAMAVTVDSYKDQHVRRVLAPVAQVAKATGAAIHFTRHFRKSGGSAEDAGGGSGGIGNACRSVLRVDRDPEGADERYLLSSVKQSLSRRPATLGYRLETVTFPNPPAGTMPEAPTIITTSRVVWDGESSWTAVDLAAHAMANDERPRADEAQDWLRDALIQGPRPARELFKAADADGIPRRTLQRAADVLQVNKERKGFGEGSLWSLPVSIRAKEPPFVPSKTMARMGAIGTNGEHDSPDHADAELVL